MSGRKLKKNCKARYAMIRRLVEPRTQGEGEMSKRPDAKWMSKEDDQLRAAAASGEAVAAISKRLCRSEKGIRHRALTLGIKLPSLRRFGFPNSPVELGLKAKGK